MNQTRQQSQIQNEKMNSKEEEKEEGEAGQKEKKRTQARDDDGGCGPWPNRRPGGEGDELGFTRGASEAAATEGEEEMGAPHIDAGAK
jgi:hypothetical protein